MVEKSQTGGLWPALYDPFRNLGTRMADWFSPAADATINGDVYRITMELPGVAEEDIDLSIDDDVVTVKGEKKTEREEKGDTWFFSERQFGSFQRSFRLPADTDGKTVKADMKDGVLTVTAKRKLDADTKARKITVKKA
jgi:HSP20 family protein